ncbi:glycoside hydrolase N-terminal domain-containing protein [Micromonospora sp. NPDC048842]|uniref:glycoside hydrolase N-terminal domain-containing protein n=1 Tax=unclassified Micromonospora TaxID=2617518 RepID=UPI003400C098
MLPNGSRGVTSPVLQGRLADARDKALAGNYGGANTDFAAGWSLRWTQTYHPGFELQISTPGMTTANGYARITDFRTGEVTSTWTDSNGTWTRRAFASRADNVVVHELTPAPRHRYAGGTLAARVPDRVSCRRSPRRHPWPPRRGGWA